MRTLTVEEAVTGLGKWLELAVAGEGIRIRKGDAIVELRPVSEKDGMEHREGLASREALRQLQAEARLTPEQVKHYLDELREERLAAETHRPT
jgi:antitoxin (DNA-binding transcriptional repressor) of toxin-antitoxin stability system